jgi:hypothetical protein
MLSLNIFLTVKSQQDYLALMGETLVVHKIGMGS